MSDAPFFELPRSVFEYLTQPEIQAGVDSVLAFGIKKVPDGLDWREVPQFYRATLAAQTVQVEWALAHEQLWRAIWPDQIAGWAPISADEQCGADYDGGISIEKCWSEEWFGRCFTRQRTSALPVSRKRQVTADVLCLAVSLSVTGASIAISVEGPSAPEADLPGFHYDEEFGSWWAPEVKVATQTLELQPLVTAATTALKCWV